jgi:hypothetical protein
MTRPSKKLSKSLNKGTDGLGNNKLREGAVAAIKQLTEHHNNLAKATQEGLNSLEAAITERLNDNSIVLQAISQIVGFEKVNEAAKAIRIKLLEDEAAEQGKNVTKALEEGKLKVVETADETCLVVTTVKKADGSLMYPSKSYLPFGFYKPEVQAVLRGKKVGEVTQLPTDGGTIEILEIYVEVNPATPEKNEEVPAAEASTSTN